MLLHNGHCNGGYIDGSHTKRPTVGSCRNYCARLPAAGYFAYSEEEFSCSCYSTAAGCPDDDQYPTYNAYRIVKQGNFCGIIDDVLYRNIMNIRIMHPCKIAFIILLLDLGTTCPSGFPNIETHSDDAHHGDLCRNEKFDGFNVGWSCPNQCIPTSGSVAPYCKVSDSNNSPCRVNEGTFFNVLVCLPYLLLFFKNWPKFFLRTFIFNSLYLKPLFL